MKSGWMCVLVSVVLLCMSFAVYPSLGEPETLIMEHEEEICKDCTEASDEANMYSVVVGNADGDATLEIVTGGTNKDHGDVSVFEWDGVSLTEPSPIPGQPPPTEGGGWTIRAVALSHITSPTYPNVIAAGRQFVSESEDPKGRVVVYTYNGAILITEASAMWSGFCKTPYQPYDDVRPMDVAASDLDRDDQVEVITASRVHFGNQWHIEIVVWYRTGLNLVAEDCMILPTTDPGDPHMAIGDIDDDTNDDIIIAVDFMPSGMQYRDGIIYAYDYALGSLNYKDEEVVSEDPNITLTSVAVGDIHGGASFEIVVVGSKEPYTWIFCKSKIWTFYWNSGAGQITAELDEVWDDSRVADVWVEDIDSDSDVEIVTTGSSIPSPTESRGEIGVWRSTGTDIVQEVLHSFSQSTHMYSTSAGDADGDTETEIVTVGHRVYGGTPGFPDPAVVAIWTWNTYPAPAYDDWPMFHHDMGHRGHSQSGAPLFKNFVADYYYQDPQNRYRHSSFSPIVSDHLVYTTVDGVVYAFDTSLGYVWDTRVQTQGMDPWLYSARSLAAGNGRVFYASFKLIGFHGLIVALDMYNGNILWQGTDFSSEIFTAPPVTYGERLLVPAMWIPGGPNGILHCLDGRNGDEIWRFEPGEDIVSSPAVHGTSVYVRAGPDLYSIPVEDPNGDGIISIPGEINWVFHMGVWGNPATIEFTGSPMVIEDRVFIGSHDGWLYAVPQVDPDPITTPKEILLTDVLWQVLLGDYVATTPAVPLSVPIPGPYLYVGADYYAGPIHSKLYKVRYDTGAIVNSVSYPGYMFTASPAVVDQKVIVWVQDSDIWGGTSAFIRAYNLDLTTMHWEHLVHKHASATDYPGCSPAVADDRVFASPGVDAILPTAPYGDRGFIYAFWD